MALPLDASVDPDQSGHVDDHETIATVLNGMSAAGDGSLAGWDTGTGAFEPVTRAALAADAALADRFGVPLNQLASGQETYPRLFGGLSTVTLVSGVVVLTYFTARKTASINNLRTANRGTASSGLTLAKMGLYSVNGSGDLTLVAATASDTALWGSTFTRYSRATTAAGAVTAGAMYAFAVLAIGTTMPGLYGANLAVAAGEMDEAPRVAARLTGQTDLPASITNASLLSSTMGSPYGVVLP